MENRPTRRVRFRFPELIDSEPPVGMLYLDAALDLLGRECFSKSWGMTHVWKQQPFRARTSEGPFYRYRPSRGKDGRWTIKTIKTVGRYDPEDLDHAALIYHEVITQFRRGAEQGLFKALYAGANDALKAIGTARWSLGLIGIFYTGFVYRGRFNDCRFRAPVLIDADNYEGWIKSLHSASSKEISLEALDRISISLREHAVQGDLKYTRARLWGLVRQAAELQKNTISENRFRRAIWAAPGLKPHRAQHGKPTREQAQALDRAEAEVSTSIAQAIQNHRRPPAVSP